MSIDDVLSHADKNMARTLDVAAEEFSGIRTGRANAGLFKSLMVDYYGTPTPLQALASITVQDARTVLITPYDKGAMHNVEKAIRDSDLGVNPSDDGQAVRLVMPELTEERRKEYVKLARSKAEESRVSVRAVRHKSREALAKMAKDGEISEDDQHRAEHGLDSKTKTYIEKIDDLLSRKEADLLAV
ncbi:MAG: ribosome recycling factor [Bifidobacteriaceae bacterium]|jgi:ribosome recycling factor|nr:ribosome recycling factor [Bifidobacteriaceae bacterium]